MSWLGIDPGSRWTGIVVRDGDDLADHLVLKRIGDDLLPATGDRSWPAYTHRILRAIDRRLDDDTRIAVEGVVPPSGFRNGQKAPLNRNQLGGLIGTAIVLGVVLTRWPTATVVRPAGFGSLGPIAYPNAIQAPGKGEDRLQHCRSAWDLTYAAQKIRRHGSVT